MQVPFFFFTPLFKLFSKVLNLGGLGPRGSTWTAIYLRSMSRPAMTGGVLITIAASAHNLMIFTLHRQFVTMNADGLIWGKSETEFWWQLHVWWDLDVWVRHTARSWGWGWTLWYMFFLSAWTGSGDGKCQTVLFGLFLCKYKLDIKVDVKYFEAGVKVCLILKKVISI